MSSNEQKAIEEYRALAEKWDKEIGNTIFDIFASAVSTPWFPSTLIDLKRRVIPDILNDKASRALFRCIGNRKIPVNKQDEFYNEDIDVFVRRCVILFGDRFSMATQYVRNPLGFYEFDVVFNTSEKSVVLSITRVDGQQLSFQIKKAAEMKIIAENLVDMFEYVEKALGEKIDRSFLKDIAKD